MKIAHQRKWIALALALMEIINGVKLCPCARILPWSIAMEIDEDDVVIVSDQDEESDCSQGSDTEVSVVSSQARPIAVKLDISN